jgi:hypothetical protein
VRIPQIEELSALLLEVPNLIELQDDRSGEFVGAVTNWLRRVEKCLVSNRIHNAGMVATVRSDLMTVVGGRVPNDLDFRSHPSPTKVLVAASSKGLREAVAVVTAVLDTEMERLRGAEALAVQLIAVAWARDLLDPRALETDRSADEMFSDTRRILLADPETAKGIHQLDALVGPHDSFVLLDRVMSMTL